MAELNKNVNAIINRATALGDVVTIFKHGKPIATITPITERSHVDEALQYLSTLEPVPVDDSIVSVLEKGRQRGV